MTSAAPTPPSTLNPHTPISCLSAALSPKHSPFEMPPPRPSSSFHPHSLAPHNSQSRVSPQPAPWPSSAVATLCAVCLLAGHCATQAGLLATPFTVQLKWALHSIPPHPGPLGIWGGRLRSLAPSYLGLSSLFTRRSNLRACIISPPHALNTQ